VPSDSDLQKFSTSDHAFFVNKGDRRTTYVKMFSPSALAFTELMPDPDFESVSRMWHKAVLYRGVLLEFRVFGGMDSFWVGTGHFGVVFGSKR